MDTWRSNRIWNLSRYLTTEDSELLRNRLQSKINSISLSAHISYIYSLFGFVSVKIDISYVVPRNGPSYKKNRKSKIMSSETRPGYNQPLYNEKTMVVRITFSLLRTKLTYFYGRKESWPIGWDKQNIFYFK